MRNTDFARWSFPVGILLYAATLSGTLLAAEGPARKVDPKLTRDYKYWRGTHEETPGPFLCIRPAATDVVVVCDRWPDTSDLRQFGLDAIRLSGAKTETEKCLAVFRWLRRVIVNSDAPYEPYAPDRCWDDYFKWLHVYGCHYCSGMGRSFEMYWRALGYRGAKVYTGHTVADVHFTDHDGVDRWHHFDVNRGRYMLDRSGRRLLSMDDLTLDSSLSRAGAVHRYQGAWSRHRAELSLRKGEKLERIWGRRGKLYQRLLYPDIRIKSRDLSWWCKQSELGPYKPAHGNGFWTYSPDLSSADWQEALAEPAVNMARGKLMPAKANTPATAVWHFRTPYIVADAEVELALARKGAADSIRLYLSVDDGKTWKPLWECPADTTGQKKLAINICKKFKVGKKSNPPADFNSPLGRYSFRVKLELTAAKAPGDCRVDGITFRTYVQQNKFALPQLQPGRNKITVRGTLAEGAALRVTYVWDDPKGKARKNVTVIEKPPYTYEIIAAGRKWEDCICKSLIVEAVPAGGKGNHTPVKEEPAQIHPLPPLPPVHETCGSWPLSKRATPTKLPPLEDVLKKLNVNAGYRELRDTVLPQIIEHADPRAWEPVVKFIHGCVKCERKRADRLMKTKKSALVALYVMDPARTRIRPFLRKFVKDPELSRGCDATVATMAKVNRWPEFVPFLADLLKSRKGSAVPILKAFAEIGDERTADAVKQYLNAKNTGQLAAAALAAGRTGDRSMIPRLRELMRWDLRTIDNYRPAKINAVLALGMLRDMESAAEIRGFLKYLPQEAWRAAAAEALGHMADKESVPALKAALEREPVPWVQRKLKEAIRRIEKSEGI